MAFKIPSELSEKQVEADVAAYFGWITPNGQSPFRLLDIDEQLTGADKLFDKVIPIYMQFKVSEGLTRLTNSLFDYPSSFPFNLSPLQRIRVFRRRENLYDNPTLYFKLRAQAKTATDFQHNILMKFSNLGSSQAFYVSPLALKKADYEDMLYNSGTRYLSYPYHFFEDTLIHQQHWVSSLNNVPFLRGHISIIPHERVTSDNHYYSFSPNGTDIAWHSPLKVSEYPQRLSDRLVQIFKVAHSNFRSWDNAEEYLSLLSNDEELSKFLPNKNNDFYSMERLMNFGRKLYQEHGIRQILLATNGETLDKMKII